MADFDALVRAAEEEWLEGWRRGPTRTRWTTLPPQRGDAAPDLELEDADGRRTRLSRFWSERPALVLFWRHYGCSCGMDRARRLREELPAYRAAGAEVVVVGQGEPPRARAYRERQKLDCAFLCDPERRAYEEFGLLEGTPEQVVFDAPDEFLRCEPDAGAGLARGRHGTERALVDNPWQLPGEFVVGRDGVIGHAHRYQWCEDYPDPRVHVAALRRAAGTL